MATLQAFDTLGYTKTLVSKGYDRDKAEALAEAQQEFFAKDVATEDFVRTEIDRAVNKLESKINDLDNKIGQVENRLDNKIEQLNNKIELENALLENRLTKSFGKTMAACTGILLAGIPLIQALLQKLG